MGYAEKAYMTAGMSANQYMSIATSFSASLLQSLEGDTKAAADYADMAMQDMADNANKMGTSIDIIQQSYQSFARGNYMMLDNLKLGFGGTKAEMERLIATAAELDESVKANDMSFGNIVKAIHVVQDEMGITGTTMKEASETITGSLMMTRAAWSNLVTGIADDNADFNQLIDNFVESAGIAAGNLLPRIEVALVGVGKLIDELFPVIMDRIPSIITETLPSILASAGNIVMTLVNGIIANAPMILETAIDIVITLANGIAQALPELVPAIANLILYLVEVITKPETLSALFDAAIAIIIALAEGLIQSIPTLLQAAVQLVAGIVRGIGSALGSIVKAGNNLVTRFADGINNKISTAVAKAKNLASRVVSAVSSGIGSVASVGANLVEGLWNGVSNKVGWVTQKMASFGRQVLDALKTFFGIESPSKLMRDEIGRFLAEGVAVGFVENDPMAEIEASLNNGIKSMNVPSVGMYGGVGGFGGSEVSIIQNIYSKAQTAADLMQEAIYQQEKAVYLGV